MNFKNVLVVGLGKSGISACEFLHSKGANVYLNDLKSEEDLKDTLKKLEGKYISGKFGVSPNECFDNIDLIVISPGVDFNNPWVIEAQKKGINIVSETELAYWFIPCDIVAITGTNGKTTTTTLVGEIFKNSGRKTHVVGNIGVAITSKVNEMKKEDIVVCELSSFQILNCKKFAPKVFSFLNLTPDHLDKYKTMENYAESKAMMLDMMDEDSYSVLNYDDDGVSKYKNRVKGQLLWFSSKGQVEKGAYCENNKVYININGEKQYIMDRDQIKIMGEHNLQNALAAIAMVYPMGVSVDVIKKTLMEFSGVEHRLEVVCETNGIRYINDSKGTNVDAGIVAIKAMDRPTVLIAGGYDKGSEFDDYIKAFKDKIKAVVVTGATAEKIEDTAYKYGYKNIYKEKDFKDAVLKASSLAKEGYNVLLSPACASWDCFKNFEQRGEYFKDIVKGLK